MQSLHVLILITAIILLSCSDGEERTTPKTRAQKVIEALTPETLNTFRQWNYTQTGKAWYQQLPGSLKSYSSFASRNDSLIIHVVRPQRFIQDFDLNIPADPRLYILTLIKSADTCLYIAQDSLIGAYRWTTLDCSADTVFKQGSPFLFFQELTRLKDSLGILSIEHDSTQGNFMQFYLSDGQVLTYLPDSLRMNPSEQKQWQETFDKGELLNKNWNLRKNTSTQGE